MKAFMRKVLVILFLTGITTYDLISQDVEVNVFSGYSFKNSFSIQGGRGEIGSGHTYGLAVGVPFLNEYQVEVMYNRQAADLFVTSTRLDEDFSDEVNVAYYMIGANRVVSSSGPLTIFTGLKIGATTVASKNDAFDTDTRFAASLALGSKVYLSPNFGLRAAVDVGFPIIQTGASIGWSPGFGPSVGVSSWSPIIRFNLQGGVFFVL